MTLKFLAFATAALTLFACGSSGDNSTPSGSAGTAGAGGTGGSVGTEAGLPVLGSLTHTPDSVTVGIVATSEHGLSTPRDLAFNPTATDQLWVASLDSSMTILFDPGTERMSAETRRGPGNTHFFARPSGIAFGDPGIFATSQEEDEITQASTPAAFMGPALWTSDLSVFDAGHAGHLDMLHNSPNSAGIAWEVGNVYWLFDGMHRSLTRYDFNSDHGPGGADHSDGVLHRYAEGAVSYVGEVPSHMEYHHASDQLYVADTGNARIAVLDATSGEEGSNISPNYDGAIQKRVEGAVVTTLVDGAAPGAGAPPFTLPSGLAIVGRVVYLGDFASSVIYGFDLNGRLIDWLDLSSEIPAGSMMGIAAGPDGSLFIADSVQSRVVRVAAKD